MSTWLYLAYLAELCIGSVAGAWFFGYALWFRWWRDELTAHLMAFSGIVELFYVYYLYRTLASPTMPPGAAQGWTRFALFTVLTAVVVWRLVVVLRFRARTRSGKAATHG